MKQHYLRFVVFWITFIIGLASVFTTLQRISVNADKADKNSLSQEKKNFTESESCQTSKFHYLKTQNELYSSKIRHIEIFLDEKAFSEENLKALFRGLSDKNSEPKHLIVEVKTNWNQLNFPSDCSGKGISNMPERPDKYDYYQATFYRLERRQNSEYFEYYPKLKTEEFKTVVMK